MPVTYDEDPLFTPSTASGVTFPEYEPSLREVAGAALRQDNAVYNLIDWAQRPTPKPDPNYTTEKLKQRPEFATHPWRFVGVESHEEEDAIASRIQKEQKDQATLAAGGVPGIAAALVIGNLDPTLAMPATWALRGARTARALEGVASGALLTGAAVAAQEAALQVNQETRTAADAAGAIGGATLLGGLLGGAFGTLTRSEAARLADVIEQGDMAHAPGATTIPQPGGAAAAERPSSAGLAPAAGGEALQNVMAQVGPVTRQLANKEFESAREVMSGLSDGGTRMADNERFTATAPGGTVENQVKGSQSGLYRAVTALDNYFMEHWYGDQTPAFAARLRSRVGSEIAGWMGSKGNRYTASEFREEVAKTLAEEKPHPNAQVNAAAAVFKKEVYDPLWEQWKAAHQAWGKPLEVEEFKAYINRVYRYDRVVQERPRFVQILSNHFERSEREAFQKAQGVLNEVRARGAEEMADLQLDPLTRAHTIDALEKELQEVTRKSSAQLLRQADLQKRVDDAKAKTKAKPDKNLATAEYVQALKEQEANAVTYREDLAQARAALAAALPESFKANKAREATIRRRLKNLKFGGFETRRANALEAVDRIETQMADSTQRFAAMVERTLDKFDELSDEVLDSRISKMRDDLEGQLKRFDNLDDKLRRMHNLVDAEDLLQRIDKLKEQITDATLRLDAAKDFSREDAREFLTNVIDTASYNLNDLNAKRALRRQKLLDEAAAASPEAVAAKVQKVDDRLRARDDAFAERWRPKIDDLEAPNFKAYADRIANEVTDKILQNSQYRLAGFDLLQGERGPEMARVLSIADREIQDFLERDVEKLAHIYTRTMSADVALMARYGSVSLDNELARVRDDFVALTTKIGETIPKGPKQEKALADAQKTYDQSVEDIKVVVQRLRHQFALPEDPRSIGHRLATTALGLNYLRMMGGMTLSSLPDMARPIMRYGLSGVFRDGFEPMIRDLGTFNLMRGVMKDMSVGLDMVLDTRTQILSDLFLNYQSRTRFEKGMEFATNKMGVVSLMAPWNAAMKQLTGIVAYSHIMRGIEAAVNGKITKTQMTLLAENGINERLAREIWAEMTNGGARLHNGTWVPELANWRNAGARKALEAAVVREVDNLIITPGAERPIMSQKILGSPDLAKVLFQFKSYGFSSVTKMAMAGLQQNDLKFYNGLVLATALGALSWWAKSYAAGGKNEKEMREAGPARWTAEAIDAAGILPMFGDVNKILERTPIGGVSRFTGQEITKSQSTDLIGALVGPTGDLLSRTNRAIQGWGSGEPTQGDTHNLRLLAAYQNLFYVRRGFDQIEANVNAYLGLPKKRNSTPIGVPLQ